jgi:hypothetical protein
VVWLEVREAILGNPSGNTSRWLFVAAAVLLFAGAAGLARAKAIGASELATAGGIAAVAAGVLGLLAFLVSVGVQITRLESGRGPTASIVGWPLALLVIGIAGLAAPALIRRDS